MLVAAGEACAERLEVNFAQVVGLVALGPLTDDVGVGGDRLVQQVVHLVEYVSDVRLFGQAADLLGQDREEGAVGAVLVGGRIGQDRAEGQGDG